MKPSMPTSGTALGASGVLLTTAGDCLPAWLICMINSVSFCVPAFAHFFSISRPRSSEITTSFIEPLPLSVTITLPVTKTPAPPFAQVPYRRTSFSDGWSFWASCSSMADLKIRFLAVFPFGKVNGVNNIILPLKLISLKM